MGIHTQAAYTVALLAFVVQDIAPEADAVFVCGHGGDGNHGPAVSIAQSQSLQLFFPNCIYSQSYRKPSAEVSALQAQPCAKSGAAASWFLHRHQGRTGLSRGVDASISRSSIAGVATAEATTRPALDWARLDEGTDMPSAGDISLIRRYDKVCVVFFNNIIFFFFHDRIARCAFARLRGSLGFESTRSID